MDHKSYFRPNWPSKIWILTELRIFLIEYLYSYLTAASCSSSWSTSWRCSCRPGPRSRPAGWRPSSRPAGLDWTPWGPWPTWPSSGSSRPRAGGSTPRRRSRLSGGQARNKCVVVASPFLTTDTHCWILLTFGKWQTRKSEMMKVMSLRVFFLWRPATMDWWMHA